MSADTSFLKQDVKFTVYSIFGTLAWLLGLIVIGDAKSAVHEIEALMLFLIGAVFFVGGRLLTAVK